MSGNLNNADVDQIDQIDAALRKARNQNFFLRFHIIVYIIMFLVLLCLSHDK